MKTENDVSLCFVCVTKCRNEIENANIKMLLIKKKTKKVRHNNREISTENW